MRWTLRARHAALILVLVVCSSRLEAAPRVQASPLTIAFSPSAGTFVDREKVTLRVRGKADIHYTLDGSLPTATSPVYRGPITLDKSTRLRAFAVAPGAPTRESVGPVA